MAESATAEWERYLIWQQAREYAALVRGLDWLIAAVPVMWPERWHMRFDRWLYGLRLTQLLEMMPPEERAAVLGVGPEHPIDQGDGSG